MELVERKAEVRWLWSHFVVSQRRVCELLNVAESSQRYVSRRNDEELRTRLVAAAREEPKWGYRRLQLKLEAKGMLVNHKRVYRVYREAGLLIRRRRRKRLLRAGFVRPVVTGVNQEWAMDFVHDAAESGRKIVAERGAPEAIRCDNGPEFTSRHFLAWALEKKIEVVHIEPGRPVQNAHVESFHGKLRDECLNASWFGNLFEARAKIAAWKEEYNHERPHSSLGYLPPAEFARRIAALRPPTAASEPQFGKQKEEDLTGKDVTSGVSNVV